MAYFNHQATPDYWDRHWVDYDLIGRVKSCKNHPLFIPMIKKYLPEGRTILEGGCGPGQIVQALEAHNYKAIGIDFAERTIECVNREVPDLDIRWGDIRKLEIDDASIDGYISGGVIEHFWDGYKTIIDEMARVLRRGGYLFLTFPYMSPLRVIKARMGVYPISKFDALNDRIDRFYQFALAPKKVINDLESSGFTLLEKVPHDGIKGFKDEIALFKPILQKIYDKPGYRRLKLRLNRILSPFAGHILFLTLLKSR